MNIAEHQPADWNPYLPTTKGTLHNDLMDCVESVPQARYSEELDEEVAGWIQANKMAAMAVFASPGVGASPGKVLGGDAGNRLAGLNADMPTIEEDLHNTSSLNYPLEARKAVESAEAPAERSQHFLQIGPRGQRRALIGCTQDLAVEGLRAGLHTVVSPQDAQTVGRLIDARFVACRDTPTRSAKLLVEVSTHRQRSTGASTGPGRRKPQRASLA